MKELLELLAQGPASGEALAARLGIGRSAVHKRIETLREAGVEIAAQAGRGYALTQPLELLDHERLLPALAPATRHELAELHCLFETDSTQRLALSVTTPAQACAVWLAERQTAGQGRRGRSWASPLAAHLYLSVARRFELGFAALSGLSLAVGVVLAEALQAQGFADIGVKWPNDLQVQGRKLGGILIELRGEAMGPCEAVIGIGLNVRMPAAAAAQIEQPWCDLAGLAPTRALSRQAVLVAVLDALLPALARFEREGLAPFAARWPRFDALAQRHVRLQEGTRTIEGVAVGIADDGALRLRTSAGERRFHGGEVTVRAT
jgi:BirA family biotin operon repressor/biotin-[acetyl-CoA-carboxylase] ligase